jgi:hypothetical protein
MGEKLSVNPWVGMWVRPRETLRAILSYNKSYLLKLLYWIYGVPVLLQVAQNASLGDRFSMGAIAGGVIVCGMLIGFVGINLMAALFHWTGRWIGGVGSFQELRAAVAWASVPSVVSIVIWATQIVMFGRQLFSVTFFTVPMMGVQLGIVYISSIISIVAMIWGIIILLKAVGEAQQFPAWKALLNVLLPFIVIFVGLKLLIWLYMLVAGAVH